MVINVIIPTYRRLKRLSHCLEALKKQIQVGDEILVVVRDTDRETRAYLEKIKTDYPALRAVEVRKPGQVAALNAGLDAAKGDIIVFTDDDAVARTDWLKRIKAHFQTDPKIGGVGGRDWVYLDGKLLDGEEKTVGRILWFGRIIGNHHLGVGKPREVEHLKGVNMSFRKEAISGIHFDERLRGKAPCGNELALSLVVKRRGWKLIYDPEIAVDHYVASRVEDMQRGELNPIKLEEDEFNEISVILKYFPFAKKIQALLWSFLCGAVVMPGIFHIFRRSPHNKYELWRAAYKGRLEAVKEHLKQVISCKHQKD